MEDMSNKEARNAGVEILWQGPLEVVKDSKGLDPVVMDLRGQCSWADCMIVVTATSQTHMRGIYYRLKEYLQGRDDLAIRSHSGTKDENRWILVDCGDLVIHIMTGEAREYYDLEHIWFESDVVHREDVSREESQLQD